MIEHMELVPPVALSSGPLGAVQAADREIARQTALRARAVARFALSRPASVDRPQGVRGAMSAARWAARPELLREVSEWAAPELSVALSITQAAAELLLERSLTLVARLPRVLGALEAGALHAGHLWPLLEHVAPIADARVRGEVEAFLLGWCAGRVTTPAQLGQKARREVLRRNARAAADELQKAIAERGVSARPAEGAGMGTLTAMLTWPEARALDAALEAYAAALPADAGDGRSRGQQKADILLDLVLRPGEGEQPPVQIALTLVASVATALGGDQPGELDGQVVPAEMVRALLRAFGERPADVPAPAPAPAAVSGGPLLSPDEWLSAPDEQLSVPERLAMERYWADLERRIMADEMLGPDPLPTGEELSAWAEARLAADPWLADDPPWDHRSTEVADLPAVDPPDPSVEEPGGGWWVSADRAVDDAGRAVYETQLAIGRAQRLVETAERADAADEAAWQTSAAGRVNAAADALGALRAAAESDRAALADLLQRSGGGGLAERPRLALTDALSGALVALTDWPGLRAAAHCGRPACRRRPERCTHDLTGRPGLGTPPPTAGYRPAGELDRFVRARDRRCRFPGCRRRVPRRGELDHDTRYPDGPTAAANLAGYCTGDHRGKHQAPGWTHRLAPDGTLTVTTPTGLIAVTTPPPY